MSCMRTVRTRPQSHALTSGTRIQDKINVHRAYVLTATSYLAVASQATCNASAHVRQLRQMPKDEVDRDVRRLHGPQAGAARQLALGWAEFVRKPPDIRTYGNATVA